MGQRIMILILKGFQIINYLSPIEFEMDDSTDEEDDDEILTECEEAVDDNESDSEGDSDSDSNWFSVIYVAVKKVPLL